jgi:predicted ferric reductase
MTNRGTAAAPQSTAQARNNRHPFAWWAMWFVTLVIVPLPLVAALNADLVDAPRQVILADLGVIAYSWWLADIYLSTRPRWIEKHVGLPSLYFLHGVVGVLSLVVAFLHSQLSFSFHPEVRIVGQIALYTLAVIVILAILSMTGLFSDRSRGAATAKKNIMRVVNHQAAIWLHRLVFVVVALIVIHVFLIPRIVRNLPFIVLFLLLTLASVGTYLWHQLVAPALPTRQATVTQNVALNDHTQLVTLQLTAGHGSAPAPGDFYFLSFPRLRKLGVTGEAHPFSVEQIRESGMLVDFVIAREGDFTSHISAIPVGTAAQVEGPFGRFEPIVQDNPSRPLVLIGMGAGIAPMLSLAQGHPERQITVIDIVSRPDDLYLQQQFEKLAHQPTSVRQPLTFLSHEHRINREWAASHISHDLIDQALFIVVGPAGGVLSMRALLRRCGVANDRIIDERLTM